MAGIVGARKLDRAGRNMLEVCGDESGKTKNGLTVKSKQPIPVFYDEVEVGKFLPEILVNDTVNISITLTTRICPRSEESSEA